MFRHFLITRFNLRNSDWVTNKSDKEVLTDSWLENRFDLFENYCFPSVKNQVNKNFEWLVYFDVTTPEAYKNKVVEFQKEMPNFKPFFIDGMDLLLESIYDYIGKLDSEYIITSTLDNDDCVSKYYIEEVQKQFNKQDFLALDFIDGYTLQVNKNVRLGKKIHLFNPFISIIEKNENPITVCKKRHAHWKYENRMQRIRNKRIWSSIIHDENMVNEFTGFGKVDLDFFLENFIVSSSTERFIRKNNQTIHGWRLLSFRNYLNSSWIVFYKLFKKKLGLYNKK